MISLVPLTKKAHVHSRTRISLATKYKICAEAFGPCSPGIRCTARKYQIGASMIRRWKESIYTLPQDDDDDFLSSKKFRCSGAGRKHEFTPVLIAHLKAFYERMREKSLSVDIRMLMLECRRVDPVSTSFLYYSAFRSRIRRLCRKEWGLSWRRATKKAQTTRTCEWLIADFKTMVQEKIKRYNIPLDNIFNVDQTNCYYSLESKYTLTKRGSRTVSVRGSGSTSRCTLMLGASMTGKKLPPYTTLWNRNINIRTIQGW
jgi:hypothetical protein